MLVFLHDFSLSRENWEMLSGILVPRLRTISPHGHVSVQILINRTVTKLQSLDGARQFADVEKNNLRIARSKLWMFLRRTACFCVGLPLRA